MIIWSLAGKQGSRHSIDSSFSLLYLTYFSKERFVARFFMYLFCQDAILAFAIKHVINWYFLLGNMTKLLAIYHSEEYKIVSVNKLFGWFVVNNLLKKVVPLVELNAMFRSVILCASVANKCNGYHTLGFPCVAVMSLVYYF